MKQQYIKSANVKKFCKSHGKRVSKVFLVFLDQYVEMKVLQAIKTHNGNKKTLDAALAGYILGGRIKLK